MPGQSRSASAAETGSAGHAYLGRGQGPQAVRGAVGVLSGGCAEGAEDSPAAACAGWFGTVSDGP